jgi:REP element-mobilizing transposase RayT
MKVPEDREVGFYHCISRVVDRRKVFREAEKEHFAALMRECEAFCEVRVLTYCLMSNHFHILVEVPRRPAVLPSPDDILRKVRRLSGHSDAGMIEQRLKMYQAAKDEAGLQAYLETFYVRMWDVSAFMKMLKQRFTQWYNGRRGRKGTLWEERFKSVLVEGAGYALAAMAAYIDLNPVRAGMVNDPKDYRWGGYGEAMAGKRRAREGLRVVAKALEGGREPTLSRGSELYRMWMFNEGSEEREALDENERPLRGTLRRADVLRVLRHKGRLPLGTYLRCRVRYFCDGAVMGSSGFVEDLFQKYRTRFGPKRKNGARRMRGLADGELYTIRDLRLSLFG